MHLIAQMLQNDIDGLTTKLEAAIVARNEVEAAHAEKMKVVLADLFVVAHADFFFPLQTYD